MPSINMIAPRRAEKKRLESNVRKLVIAILVELCVLVFGSLLFVTHLIGTRSMVTSLDVQLAKLQPRVKEIEDFEAKTSALQPKIETLNQAKVDTLRWCSVLSDLSASLPEKTWLTRISTTPPLPDSDEITVSLNGVAIDQSQVGQAMLRMHDTVRQFSSIDLHYTQKTVLGPVTAVEFEMAAGIKLPNKDNKGEVQKN